MITEFDLQISLLSKSQERLDFENNHNIYIYSTRDGNIYGYSIDCILPLYKDWSDINRLNKTLSNVPKLKLRTRFNAGETRAIWLPKEFGDLDHQWFENNKDLLNKYSFSI